MKIFGKISKSEINKAVEQILNGDVESLKEYIDDDTIEKLRTKMIEIKTSIDKKIYPEKIYIHAHDTLGMNLIEIALSPKPGFISYNIEGV